MYYILGNSPKKVELKDLNDCVYYKQPKAFTDAQYDSSPDLRRAIERKTLIITSRTVDKNLSCEPSNITQVSTPVEDKSVPAVNILLERINTLEEALKNKKAETTESTDKASLAVFTLILERLEKLESQATQNNNMDLSPIVDSIKSIEERLKDNKSDSILEKLENIEQKAVSGGYTATIPNQSSGPKEEIYVPNIKVEDANSHISLEVRKLDTGDSVSDSLKKLKELKEKNK